MNSTCVVMLPCIRSSAFFNDSVLTHESRLKARCTCCRLSLDTKLPRAQRRQRQCSCALCVFSLRCMHTHFNNVCIDCAHSFTLLTIGLATLVVMGIVIIFQARRTKHAQNIVIGQCFTPCMLCLSPSVNSYISMQARFAREPCWPSVGPLPCKFCFSAVDIHMYIYVLRRSPVILRAGREF